jgi:DNA-binding response OmpR family regulator
MSGLRKHHRSGGTRVQVLIVGQDRDLAAIWAGFLTRQGAQVTVAGNGAESCLALRR